MNFKASEQQKIIDLHKYQYIQEFSQNTNDHNHRLKYTNHMYLLMRTIALRKKYAIENK